MQSSAFDPLKVAQRYWSMSLVRGVVAIIFGLLAIFWPHLTFSLFMMVFGVFAIIEGLILLGNSFAQRTVHVPTTNAARRADTAPQTDAMPGRERVTREEFGYGGARAQAQPQPQAYPSRSTNYETHRANRPTLMIEGVLSIICGILALVLPGAIGILALYVIAAWALFKGVGALMQTGTRGWVLGAIGVMGILLALIVLFNPLRIIHSLIVVIGIFALIMGAMLVLRSMGKNALHRAKRPLEPNY